MGTTYVDVTIRNPADRRRSWTAKFLVDTGAFVFMLVTAGGALTLWGGGPGMELVVLNMQTAPSTFTLLAIVEFTLMGMVIFHSGMGNTMLRVLGDWLGSIPGRLSILGIAFAILFATMSGSSLASSTVMATVLTPEMEKQGYKKPMSLGPILGGGLAMMIPPSGARHHPRRHRQDLGGQDPHRRSDSGAPGIALWLPNLL